MARRRTKGTGSVTLRGGTYWIEYQEKGHRVRESAHTADRDEAERFLKQRIGEIATGRDIVPEKATISDLCALVIGDYTFRKLRDLQNVKWRFESHIKALLGSLPASKVGASQIRAYVTARRDEGASDATINRELAIVRRGFSLGHQEDPPLVRRIPHIAKLEEDNVREGFIEDAQYLTLRYALPDHLKAIFVVGYHCGNRLGELRKLRWDLVDLAGREIRIQRRNAKAKRPRTIPIYGDMIEWLEWQEKRRVPGCDLVFHWEGKPLGSHIKGWSKACAAAGLPGLHFHDLRRSAVRNMERAGIPRKVAMEISGHLTEAVYRRYDIVVDSDLKAAAKRLTEYHQKQRPKLKRVK